MCGLSDRASGHIAPVWRGKTRCYCNCSLVSADALETPEPLRLAVDGSKSENAAKDHLSMSLPA